LNSVVSSNSLGTTIWKLHFSLIIPNYGVLDTRIAASCHNVRKWQKEKCKK
jgi:hypothetical protein